MKTSQLIVADISIATTIIQDNYKNMSTRAYKLIEIKTEKDPTFNVSREQNIYNLGNESEQIILTYEKETVQEELHKLSVIPYPSVQIMEDKISLQRIFKDMDGEDYIEYYCY